MLLLLTVDSALSMGVLAAERLGEVAYTCFLVFPGLLGLICFVTQISSLNASWGEPGSLLNFTSDTKLRAEHGPSLMSMWFSSDLLLF